MGAIIVNQKKTDIDINLPLRSEVLEIALYLEDRVNSLLLTLLFIEKPNRKALSNKSGSLSFKNKIDLLFDLDILKSAEHQNFILYMEFRNQFMHNITCCSFEDAISQLGTARGKTLLKFDDSDDKGKNVKNEIRYQKAFRKLYIACLRIIANKIKYRMNQLDDHGKINKKLIEGHSFIIKRYFNFIEKVMLICQENLSDIPEVTKLIKQLNETTENDVHSLKDFDEYLQNLEVFKNFDPLEKINCLSSK
jgi:hypothetical protein